MNNQISFLQSVSDYLLERSADYRDALLLFPNKRSSLFMRRYLKRNTSTPAILPKLRTLGSFMGTITGMTEASRMEQLFTLYDSYCEVSDRLNGYHHSFD